MKSKASSKRTPSHLNFSIPLSIGTFFVGVIATLAISRVFAQTADTNQIYACVNKTNGNVRVVTSEVPCKDQERSIKWSIQGPPGPQGPAGSTGGLNQYFGLPFICNSCYLANLGDRFMDKDFTKAHITKSDFTAANITGVKFKGAFLSSVNFTDGNLTGADLSDIRDLPNGLIPQNNLFIRSNLTNANFTNSILHEANFTGANLQNTNFSNSLLRRAKFTDAQNLSTANFSGATFEGVTCPDGTNSDSNNNSCDGHF